MRTQTIAWTIIFFVAAIFLAYRASTGDLGRAYVRHVPQEFVNVAAPDEDPDWIAVEDVQAEEIPEGAPRISWTQVEQANYREYQEADRADPTQTEYVFSFWNTVGLWVAAFFTLSILSFVYRDNPLYKIAESVFVGVSAAYWMVVGFWSVVIPNLIGKLWPGLIQAWALPGLEGRDLQPDYYYVIPLILGVMLLWRLSPVGGWIARWPLAFIIGVFCGLRLVTYLQADFMAQIRNTIVPLAVFSEADEFDLWKSIEHLLLVGGVLACLVYFFFSLEHKGVVGKVARSGIWVLMITFGAGFGFTVMGRIALLAIRLEFLLDDWLWLIDPMHRRTVLEAVGLLAFPGIWPG